MRLVQSFKLLYTDYMQPDSNFNSMPPQAREALTAQLTTLMESGHLAEFIDELKAQTASDASVLKTQLEKVAAILNNRGVALSRNGQSETALPYFLHALRASESCAPALSNAASCLKDLGRLEESMSAYRQVLMLNPDLAQARSNLLFNMHYNSAMTAEQLNIAHKEWDVRHGSLIHQSPKHYKNSRDPERILHVGFVSPDFGQHPVGIFLIRFLENIDPSQTVLHAYATTQRVDKLAERFHRAITHWNDVRDMSDDEIAKKVQADGIDILIDMSGHSADARLGVFARKPAPIQMTWLGYPGEAGLATIDYVIGDRFVLPETMQPHLQAKILQLPHGFVCFDPPDDAPPITPLPAIEAGVVTFGCFHNPAKCEPDVIALWAEILNRLPKSRLIFKYQAFGSPSVQKRFQEQFATRGVNTSRLEFQDRSPLPEMFDQMSRVDIALDTFPFSGGLMSCYTLWMGLPLITLPLESFASRQGLCFLSLLDLPETIASDKRDYVDKAVALANDLPRLMALRKKLRPTMEASPLCDAQLAQAGFQDLLRNVWHDWCEAI